QERRLADVRVSGQRHGRRLRAATRLPPRVALTAELREAALEDGDAPAGETAVGLELGLARPTRSDTAAESLEVLPHAPHAREVVLELRELDLELALGAHGVLGE